MTPITNIDSYFALLSATIERLQVHSLNAIVESLLWAFENDKTVYVFGNGGSASLASHFACDLGKGTANGTGKRFRVMALTDNLPLITAWANDSSYDHIFAEQLTNFVRPQDVAFAISASGNSRNVINALQVARQAGATTLGITGFKGGLMRELCDKCTIVPSENMQIIEDLHLSIAHAIFTVARARTCKVFSATA